MKLSILEMQAVEFALHENGFNLHPVYRNTEGKIFTGHFFVTDESTNLFFWSLDNFQIPIKKPVQPAGAANIFIGWGRSLDDSSLKLDVVPFSVFHAIRRLHEARDEYEHPKQIRSLRKDFDGLNFIFNFQSDSVQLSFVELTEPEYEFIALEEN